LVKHQLPIAEYVTMDADSIRNVLSQDAYTQLRGHGAGIKIAIAQSLSHPARHSRLPRPSRPIYRNLKLLSHN
jgi:hypothetical protein